MNLNSEMVPTLKTDRLILRARTMDDLDKCVEMDIDPDVYRYLATEYDGSKQHIDFLKERINTLYPPGLGYWSIYSSDVTDEFLGWVHLLPSKHDENATEIGWRLKRSAWGFGYATEAARALLFYAFEIIATERVFAETLVDNARSIRVMERLGMKHHSEFMFNGTLPSLRYVISNNEFYGKFKSLPHTNLYKI